MDRVVRAVPKVYVVGGFRNLHIARPDDEGLERGRSLCGRLFYGRSDIPLSGPVPRPLHLCSRCARARLRALGA